MKSRIRVIAALLYVILSISCLFSSCTPAVDTMSPAATLPTTTADSSTTEFSTPPTSEVTVPPVTDPTVPPTTAPSTPTEPATTPTQPANTPLTASHAFIYHCQDDSFLFLKGEMKERIYPASITKLLTAYVALQHLDPARQITVGSAIYTVPPDSSLAFVSVGDVLTTEQLLHGMLLPSGGDAARVVAAEAGRVISGKSDISDVDAIAVFMDEMNRQATVLGMTGSHFVTPDGFHDPNHYTTMSDMLLLAKLSLEIPLIRKVVSTAEYTVTLAGRSTTWRNTNMLLHQSPMHPEFYRETTIGLKTGYTHAAGRCLLAAFQIEDKLILSGIFGCPDPNMGFIAQFENACYLYDTYLAP